MTPISYIRPSWTTLWAFVKCPTTQLLTVYLVLRSNFSTGAVYQHLAQQTDRHSEEVSLYPVVSRLEVRNCGLGAWKQSSFMSISDTPWRMLISSRPPPPQKKNPQQQTNKKQNKTKQNTTTTATKKTGVEVSTRLPPGRAKKFSMTAV